MLRLSHRRAGIGPTLKGEIMSSDYVAQREALVDLSVAYEGARDITRQVLCTAFGNVALGSVPPPSECVWPLDITQAEADSRLRAVQRFLAQTEAVFKKVLCKIEDAQVRLVASGFDVPRSWIIIDPLDTIKGWYLRACGVEEIVRNAASEDSALQVIVEELSIDVRLLKSDGELTQPAEGQGDAFVQASHLWKDRFPDYKKFKNWLDKQPESVIRRHNPSPQRLMVHAGDWHRHWAEQDSKGFEQLDDASAEQIADIEAKKAAARAAKTKVRN
jgi:hypothetical protein